MVFTQEWQQFGLACWMRRWRVKWGFFSSLHLQRKIFKELHYFLPTAWQWHNEYDVKKSRARKTPKRVSQGQHYLNPKTRWRKLQANVPDERRCWSPQQNISKLDPAIHWKYDLVQFILGIKGWYSICKSINVIYHIKMD